MHVATTEIFVWNKSSPYTEFALELHMKETDGVLIMQLSRLDKMICYSTFCDDQFICLVCISIFVISEVFEDSSLNKRRLYFHLPITIPVSS